MTRYLGRLLAPLLLGSSMTVSVCGAQGASEATPSVEIRYLANCGFLLRGDGKGVLVDAFLARPYTIYGDVPQEDMLEIVSGGAPFHDLRLALVSHLHEDHFQIDMARIFLQRRPEVALLSCPQVVETLRSPSGELPSQVHEVWPEPATIEDLDVAGVHEEVLRIPHGSEEHAAVQNLACIVHLAGRRILHLGDATMQSAAYEPYAAALRNLDVALVPYWFFEDEEGRATLEKYLQARLVIAMHVPVHEIEAVTARLHQSDPDVVVFQEAMQFMRF